MKQTKKSTSRVQRVPTLLSVPDGGVFVDLSVDM